MTTETPQPSQVDVVEIYRSLGRLENAQGELKEQFVRYEERNEAQFTRFEERIEARLIQSEERTEARLIQSEERTEARLVQSEERTEARFARLEGRIDRLVLTLFGFGATIMATMAAILVKLLLGG